jgi:GPH family glycoside/pentoside/hexuronide:cation symporter
MSTQEHYQTATEDKISTLRKIIYGFGAFVNNLLGAAIGTMTIVLNLGLGMNPALVGSFGRCLYRSANGVYFRSHKIKVG